MKKAAALLTATLAVIVLSACADQPTSVNTKTDTLESQNSNKDPIDVQAEPQNTPEASDQQSSIDSSWQTYNNEELGFSIRVPDRVLQYSNDPNSWATLNIVEYDQSVYFTTESQEDTIQTVLENGYSWNFRIGGTTIDTQEDALPFLESYYGVQGCETNFVKDDAAATVYSIGFSAVDSTLDPDDLDACFVGGKLRITYDETSGKLITYRLFEPLFFVPGGNLGEESLESLEFPTGPNS